MFLGNWIFGRNCVIALLGHICRNILVQLFVFSSSPSVPGGFVVPRTTRKSYPAPVCADSPMAVFFSRDTRAGLYLPTPCVDDVISGTGFVRADTCSSRIVQEDPLRYSRVAHSYGFHECFALLRSVSQFYIQPDVCYF